MSMLMCPNGSIVATETHRKHKSVQAAILKQAVAKLASIDTCCTNNMSSQRTHIRQMRMKYHSTIQDVEKEKKRLRLSASV